MKTRYMIEKPDGFRFFVSEDNTPVCGGNYLFVKADALAKRVNGKLFIDTANNGDDYCIGDRYKLVR